MPKRNAKKPLTELDPPETQVADAITVLWLLLTMTALVCEIAWAATRWYLASHPERESAVALHFLLAFSSLVTGGLVLLLVPVVLKIRRLAPPRGITIATVVIGAAPFLVVLALLAK